MRTRSEIIMFSIGLLVFLGMGVFVLLLYTVPAFKPWGMTGVWVDSKFMTYIGDEIEHLFDQRNIQIESSNAEIIVRIRKIGQEDSARVTVFEDANGVAFNSMNRTQVDFMEALDKKTGVPYTKVKIREPKGAIKRTARVYINLKRDAAGSADPYNFILDTGASPVTFNYDASAEELQISKLVVNGTGQVKFPNPTAEASFTMSVETLEVNSSAAKLYCPWPVTGASTVEGISSDVTLGDIRTLDVKGQNHSVTVDNASGAINFKPNTGSLTVKENHTGTLTVDSDAVNLNVNKTDTLVVDSDTGNVNVKSVWLTSTVKMSGGGLTLGSKGTDSGVRGDVKIDKNYGGMNVTFANSVGAVGMTEIDAIDGAINVHGARGKVAIFIASIGKANVAVGFAAVANDSAIIVEGSREPGDIGGGIITVTLYSGVGANFHFRSTSEISGNLPGTNDPENCINGHHRSATELENEYLDWECEPGVCLLHPISNGLSNSQSILHVKTQNNVIINSGNY